MTRFTFSRALALTGILVGASVAPVSAQIFTWRDQAGNLVLSNNRPEHVEGLKSYSVPKSADVRATRRAPMSSAHEAYEDLIIEHSTRHNVRQSLVRAVIQVESGFNPVARSPKGAMGLMQLMPATARDLGVQNPFDPSQNVRGGVLYLRQLLDRYDGNEELALAAYNAGPGAVDRHHQKVPPFLETKQYVLKVNHLAGARRPPAPGTQLYQSLDVVDGRTIIKYTDQPPRH